MIPLLVFFLVLVGLLLRYLQLRRRLRASESLWLDCRRRLTELSRELARYAQAHEGYLPENVDRVLEALPSTSEPCGLVYRHFPELAQDGRLILAYDNAPRHPVMRFPHLGEGRNVLFASGKVDLFEEEAVHQLIVGDNVLRDRLGLPEIPFLEVSDG